MNELKTTPAVRDSRPSDVTFFESQPQRSEPLTPEERESINLFYASHFEQLPTMCDADPIRVGPLWVTCDKCGEEYNTSSIHVCEQPPATDTASPGWTPEYVEKIWNTVFEDGVSLPDLLKAFYVSVSDAHNAELNTHEQAWVRGYKQGVVDGDAQLQRVIDRLTKDHDDEVRKPLVDALEWIVENGEPGTSIHTKAADALASLDAKTDQA